MPRYNPQTKQVTRDLNFKRTDLMKKHLILSVSVVALAALTAQTAAAHPGRGHHRHPPHHGGGDYADGFFAGLVASTAAIFLTHTSAYNQYKELVMMGADEDAAAYLATNEQPTALLQAAMKLERGVLAEAGVQELSDEAIAQVIIERAATLK